MTKPLYFYNGTTFEQIGPTTPQSPIAYQTSAPTGPATGDLWVDSDGDVDTYNRQLTRYYFIATAAQTTISGVDANSLTLAYVAGSEAVYVNGALQVRGQDYTATNGTSVVMSSALAVNDVVEIFAYTAFTVANAYTKAESDSLVGAAPGLKLLVPTSVAVGSGSGSVGTNGTVSFTSASTISLNDVFSATYKNYKILMNITGSTTNVNVGMRLRVSGADNSTANYGQQVIESGGTSVSAIRDSGQTQFVRVAAAQTGKNQLHILDIANPFQTEITSAIGFRNRDAGTSSAETSHVSSAFVATTSFTGFTLIPTSGNLTGTISVYGFKE